MSAVSRRLGARGVTGGHRAVSEAQSLASARVGERLRITGLGDSDEASARRLFDLGLVPGAEVTLVRRSPLADPAIYRVADYELALRRAQAQMITVEVI